VDGIADVDITVASDCDTDREAAVGVAINLALARQHGGGGGARRQFQYALPPAVGDIDAAGGVYRNALGELGAAKRQHRCRRACAGRKKKSP
jgi:hypothetical protein